MTEDEAKGKWCPHARIANDTGSHNAEYTGGRIQPSSFCIASACMAWRHTGDKPLMDGASTALRWIPTGYCGLAGAQP